MGRDGRGGEGGGGGEGREKLRSFSIDKCQR